MGRKGTAPVKRPASTIAPDGWFSRKHRSSAPHETAVALYLGQRGPAARKRRAIERRRPSDEFEWVAEKHDTKGRMK